MMWNSSQMPLPPSMSRASRAIASAFPHEFRFSIDTTSGAALQGQGQGQGCCHPLRQPPPPAARWYPPALILEAPEAQAGLQPQCDLCHHVRQLLLHQLVARQRPPELFPAAQSVVLGMLRGAPSRTHPLPRCPVGTALPVEDVLPRHLQTGLGGPQSAPGDAVPGVVEAAERALGRVGVTGDPTAGRPRPASLPLPSLTDSPTAWGSRFSSGTSTSSSTIMPVVEARSENLPSMRGVLSPGVPRSTRKPRTRPSSSHTAHTRHRSATGALVILAGGEGEVRALAPGVPAPWHPPGSEPHQVLVPRSM